MKSLVTIVIATLNCEALIEDCIKSIRLCCENDVEILVQDGGSTDKTLEILQSLEINFVSEKDNGIYDAFNKALKRIKTKWVLFLGADDKLLINPNKLIHYLDESASCVLYANVINSDTGAKYDGRFTKFKLARKNICQQAILYPVLIFRELNFDLKYKYLADYDLNMKLKKIKLPFVYVDDCLTLYGNAGLSKQGDQVFEREKYIKVIKYLGVSAFVVYIQYILLKKIYKFINKFLSLLKYK